MKGRGSGVTITRKGYVRITAGLHRHMMEHRAVTARSVAEFCPPPLRPLGSDGVPQGYQVHHADWRKAHNCPHNLQLLQPAIHRALANAYRGARDLSLVRMLLSAGEAMTI